jgi:hypothetical protein
MRTSVDVYAGKAALRSDIRSLVTGIEKQLHHAGCVYQAGSVNFTSSICSLNLLLCASTPKLTCAGVAALFVHCKMVGKVLDPAWSPNHHQLLYCPTATTAGGD